MTDYNKNVFVNCPFDKDYRQIFFAVLFTVRYIGYQPRISLEESDCAAIRIQKIVKLIEESKIGIHDLSRMEASVAGESFRMNMPFELGIDYAAKHLQHGNSNWSDKSILILETDRYRYQKALSDLSGCDIKSHDNDPLKAIKAVRNWFVVQEKLKAPSHSVIWDKFNYFNGYLDDALVESGHEEADFDEIPIPEILAHLDDWLLVQ